ncbi:MAG TPA: dihydrofolate reductase [Candidatus Onthovicinus excrementipullorum]|nr:dihydrofolate reductase [Candidatus Onthovicinus excrementipullorum]
MKKVTLFIAMSLDGYIADCSGGVDWLTGTGTQETDSYGDFIQEIDTVIMGGNTYRQIITQLSPNIWPYEGMKSYVITHRGTVASRDDIYMVHQSPCDLVRQLREQDGKGIWICGGAQVVRQLMEADLIDRYHFSVMPVLLGDGIPLLVPGMRKHLLRLVRTQSYNGITDLIYERREQAAEQPSSSAQC